NASNGRCRCRWSPGGRPGPGVQWSSFDRPADRSLRSVTSSAREVHDMARRLRGSWGRWAPRAALPRILLAGSLLSAPLIAPPASGTDTGRLAGQDLLATTARGNGLIAFVSTRTGNSNVWTMFFDGDSQIDITNHP